MLETGAHPPGSSWFSTFTYEAPPLTPEGRPTLAKRDAELFRMRLRNKLGVQTRFFMVGEYGDRTERPHYHAAFFGADRADFPELVDKAWGLGHTSSSLLDATRAAYLAGYCTKKMTSPDDIRLGSRHPEFSQMSRRPALADGMVQKIGDYLTRPGGRKFLEQHGDVPHVYRIEGKLWPLTDRHRRILRKRCGLPELKRDVVALNPTHPSHMVEPELPSIEEVLNRRSLEVKRAKKAQIFKSRFISQRV